MLNCARSFGEKIMNIFRGPGYKNRFVILLCVCVYALFPAVIHGQKKEPLPQLLPTGQAITPTATMNSRFQTLKPGLAGFPNHEVGYAVSTAISPNGKTLLVLTSGYTEVRDKKGVKDKNASMEFILSSIFRVNGQNRFRRFRYCTRLAELFGIRTGMNFMLAAAWTM